MKLSGNTILITGGTSGIGLELAIRLWVVSSNQDNFSFQLRVAPARFNQRVATNAKHFVAISWSGFARNTDQFFQGNLA